MGDPDIDGNALKFEIGELLAKGAADIVLRSYENDLSLTDARMDAGSGAMNDIGSPLVGCANASR